MRTSLTLAACLGKPVTIRNIRGTRSVGGLRPHHLACVRAAHEICGAPSDALEAGQTKLVFEPGAIRAGTYTYEVAQAGSTNLVLQTIALPLCFSETPTIVKVNGGTHNPKAPCFEYLAHVWVPLMRRIGLPMGIGMAKAGFYPKGGGTLVAQIEGGLRPESLQALDLMERGELKSVDLAVKIANHPMSVGYRLRKAANYQMKRRGLATEDLELEIELIDAFDPAACCVVRAAFENTQTVSVGVSTKGKTPEGAAADAVGEVADFADEEKSAGAALDAYSADQVMVPLALAPGPSRFTTSCITEHCLTNAALIQKIAARSVDIQGEKGKPGTIRIR